MILYDSASKTRSADSCICLQLQLRSCHRVGLMATSWLLITRERMISIFSLNLRTRHGSQQDALGELSCQLAAHDDVSASSQIAGKVAPVLAAQKAPASVAFFIYPYHTQQLHELPVVIQSTQGTSSPCRNLEGSSNCLRNPVLDVGVI